MADFNFLSAKEFKTRHSPIFFLKMIKQRAPMMLGVEHPTFRLRDRDVTTSQPYPSSLVDFNHNLILWLIISHNFSKIRFALS